jgi:hypothetical protein
MSILLGAGWDDENIRHAMVSKEREEGGREFMPHGSWHQGANQVKHNIARALPFPPILGGDRQACNTYYG